MLATYEMPSEVGPGELQEQFQCMPFYMLLFAPRSFLFSQQSKWNETFHRSIVCWVRHPSPRWELCKERTHAKTPTMQVAPTRWMGVLGSMARDHASILKHTAQQLLDSLNCRWKTCVDRYLNLEKGERSRKLRTMLVTATNCSIFQLMMLQANFFSLFKKFWWAACESCIMYVGHVVLIKLHNLTRK